MAQSGTYCYCADAQSQMVALPYRGGYSMHVVLPAAGTDWKRFQMSLKSGLWESWVARLKREKGLIRLPRLNLDFEVQLENALTALGMEHPFGRDRAEFGEIQTDLQPVWIDQVIHRAVAEVDEAGT